MGAQYTFNKCCGCIELKTGCFIIGYLNLIGVIALAVMTAIITMAGGLVVANKDAFNSEDGSTNGAEAAQAGGIFMLVVGGIMLFFLIFALAFCIVLLVGLHKNKPGHLKAYMIYAVIFNVIWFIGFIISAVNEPKAGQIFKDLMTILLNIYFLLIIRSQYYVMIDTRGGPAIYSAA